jgi:4-hydroxybenzoate polyprenyltransferase
MLGASIKSKARTLLLLGRASNLPTVWSNCLAGWFLGGAGRGLDLFLLALGASFVYIGGMFLNDAFDADFDRQHRKERPIPSGAISVEEVWFWGLGWLSVGGLILIAFGKVSALLTIALIFCVLLYDWVHKAIAFSPVIMAACRFFLFLVAASVGHRGVQGLAIWSSFIS